MTTIVQVSNLFKSKMRRIEFNIKTPQGIILVHFDEQKSELTTAIRNIWIESTYDSGLPRHPELQFWNGQWCLVAKHKRFIRGEVKQVTEELTDEVSKEIARILVLRRNSR